MDDSRLLLGRSTLEPALARAAVEPGVLRAVRPVHTRPYLPTNMVPAKIP